MSFFWENSAWEDSDRHLSTLRRMGYFSGQSGEVDFVNPKKWAIEVKWSAVASNLSKAFLNLQTPWKRVWTHTTFGDLPPKGDGGVYR